MIFFVVAVAVAGYYCVESDSGCRVSSGGNVAASTAQTPPIKEAVMVAEGPRHQLESRRGVLAVSSMTGNLEAVHIYRTSRDAHPLSDCSIPRRTEQSGQSLETARIRHKTIDYRSSLPSSCCL